jgi:rhamnulokinase
MVPARHDLAIDLGAGSGRAIAGRFDGSRIYLEEIHRFPNDPVLLPEGMRWDAPRLLQEALDALTIAARKSSAPLDGMAVDTWGVDFGLFDEAGGLLGLPAHYRDRRTAGVAERAFLTMPRSALYAATGVQPISFVTLFQLLAARSAPVSGAARSLLLMPDLMSYWLCGECAAEQTIASTTALAEPGARAWSREVLERFEIDGRLLQPLIAPATRLGRLRPELARGAGTDPVPVIATAGHDTASAFAAGAGPSGTLAISSGTWSLVGVELPGPLLTPGAEAAGFSNETGVAGSTRFLRGIAGLWLVQECRRSWIRAGRTRNYDELDALAAEASPLRSLVDVEHPAFLAPEDMPATIAARCLASGEPAPVDEGAFVRCALESLALSYRRALEQVETITGQRLTAVRLFGGGAHSALHCQLAADATGRPVTAGPVEATAIGNLLVQAMADGELRTLDELREVVARSVELRTYEPTTDRAAWNAAYHRFERLQEVRR